MRYTKKVPKNSKKKVKQKQNNSKENACCIFCEIRFNTYDIYEPSKALLLLEKKYWTADFIIEQKKLKN